MRHPQSKGSRRRRNNRDRSPPSICSSHPAATPLPLCTGSPIVGENALPNSPEILDLVSSPDGEAADNAGSKLEKKTQKKMKPTQKRSRISRKKDESWVDDDDYDDDDDDDDDDEDDDDDDDDDSFYNSLLLCKKTRRNAASRCTNSRQQNQLDTNAFETYLEVLWRNTSESKKKSVSYLDSLWFSLYKEGLTDEGDQNKKVLRWIKEKEIFSCNYVFVPIICWRHWNLLILCHIGESIFSKTRRPCMLLLDSLEKTDPMRLEPDIRRFAWDIYKLGPNGSLTRRDLWSKIPLLVPKVPQQRNGDDCGIFVLYFIHLFLKMAPKVFSLEHYPDFLTKEWFGFEELEAFRKKLLSMETSSGYPLE